MNTPSTQSNGPICIVAALHQEISALLALLSDARCVRIGNGVQLMPDRTCVDQRQHSGGGVDGADEFVKAKRRVFRWLDSAVVFADQHMQKKGAVAPFPL